MTDPLTARLRELVDEVKRLERAINSGFSGSAEHGSFIRGGGGEVVPGPHFILSGIYERLYALLAAAVPVAELPPSLAAEVALFHENPIAWHEEWTRKHAFKVGLIRLAESAVAAPTPAAPNLSSQLAEAVDAYLVALGAPSNLDDDWVGDMQLARGRLVTMACNWRAAALAEKGQP